MINKLFKTLSFAAVLQLAAFSAHAFETKATHAVIIDVDTQTVLFEKNSKEQMPTSSMSKVMTAYAVFDAIDNGLVDLDDQFTVSEKAWKKGGSKMFIEVGKKVKVEDLLRGLIIQSGNDAAIALAEGVGGSEDAFAQILNEKAQDIGMYDSNFVNASGWPVPNHYSTAYDLAILAYNLIHNYPQYYHYYSEKEFTYNGIRQSNRNPLLYKNIGVDGIKTGHTEIAGYGLMASAVQNGNRRILVVNGLKSTKERSSESERLLNWSYRNFKNAELFAPNEQVTTAQTWMGVQNSIPVIVSEKVNAVYNIRDKKNVNVKAIINEPIAAPIQKGQEVGVLQITMGDFPTRTFPLYAGQDVNRKGAMARIAERLKLLIK